MAINWDNFDETVALAAKDSSAETNQALVSEISSITRLTDKEIQELFPTVSDTKRLGELMKIVKSGESRNDKVNRIVSNSEELGGVILSLLTKLV